MLTLSKTSVTSGTRSQTFNTSVFVESVEALVLPNLGPDKMLLDNSIMNAFGAVLDRCGEQLSFKNSTRQIPAKPKRTNSQVDTDGSAPTQISIVALDPSVGVVPVYLRRKCCIPPEHEMTVDVVTENAPSETTPAFIESRIVTAPVSYTHLTLPTKA